MCGALAGAMTTRAPSSPSRLFLFSLAGLLGVVLALTPRTIWAQSCVPSTHLKHFGFTLVDVGWDDPLDDVVQTSYLDEVAPFSNLADQMVVDPRASIVTRTRAMNARGVRALLHINELFFQEVDGNAPSGHRYALRPDYAQRWATFRAVNAAVMSPTAVQVLYLGEEPTWNGISYAQLKSASDLIAATTTIPILVVEAYTALQTLRIPSSVDWVGFDHYFIKDPLHDATFQRELALLKSKLSRADQKLAFIMDSFYFPALHGYFGIQQSDLRAIAGAYYTMAQAEPRAVALLGYTWPGGFDDPTALGARQLDLLTQLRYIGIGQCITGKIVSPAALLGGAPAL